MSIPGEATSFHTKLEQAAQMLVHLAHHFVGVPVTVVCDSWFGNDSLFKPVRNYLGNSFALPATLQCRPLLYGADKEHKGKTRKTT